MNVREILGQTFAALRAHKMRSFLTMFGIVWGITSVILLVGLGYGFNVDQAKRMRTIGSDLIVIWGGRTSAQAGGYAAGRPIRLNVDDARRLKAEAYLLKNVSPEIVKPVTEVSRYNASNRPVRGVWPAYQVYRSLELAEGRLMTQEDEDAGNRVVVLGHESNQQLFRGKPALGETVMIAGYPYTVIGVLAKKKQNGSYGQGPDNTQLFVPYSAMARDFPPANRPGIERGWVSDIAVEVANPEEHEEAVRQIRTILASQHHFEPTDKDALFMWDTMKGAEMMRRIFGTMTIFFGCVALLTLALGGIGVMNIMLVSVTERTREIGVRKAIGATATDIRRQFFAESAVITCVSGVLGLAIGVGICMLMRAVPLPEFVPHPVISRTAMVASISMLSLITICAGMYPANRAAGLVPVECLRYE